MIEILKEWLMKPKPVKPIQPRMTDNELMTRLKVFIGVCLAVTLIGIVFVVLYSIMFVTQPLNAISPVDAKFFELIIPIATFLTGTLSGIMLAGTGENAALAGSNSNKPQPVASAPKPAPAPAKKEEEFGEDFEP
jgi:hypothetical protein